eukprot:CAMPEP_0171978908 /NCGR_PEP_ID=MMETSP0993-20121228/254451_1 /TAXON_ID=483369 /ORGANISM="non described non described, Strain CCMP2098" /LENGTH=33 /DNA_ID= /DNA_START= /DNA_END= /DNA_ORIENTATION=
MGGDACLFDPITNVLDYHTGVWEGRSSSALPSW